MPSVKIGRHRFNLDKVTRIDEWAASDSGVEEVGITIFLERTPSVELRGEQARAFLQFYDEQVTLLTILVERPPLGEPSPPGGRESPTPLPAADPGHAVGVEQPDLGGGEPPRDLEDAERPLRRHARPHRAEPATGDVARVP